MEYQINQTDILLKSITGEAATLLRPPYGNYNKTVSGFSKTPIILWSVDTLDWETSDPSKIAQLVLEKATDGAIILLHDIFKSTIDASEIFIPQLIEKGYNLVTVSELAKIKNNSLIAGNVYSSF